ncbi:MAG TPA: nucleotidyltransferase family protein [Candidatus Baltobacteraceae bacterium]
MAASTGSARVTLRGNSMRPDLREGMTLEIVKGPPRVGAIAVFRFGSSVLAHRVLAVRDNTVICGGDAHAGYVERIDAADVAGTVRAVYDANGERVDGIAFRLRGLARARFHRLRAICSLTLPNVRPRCYATLIEMMSAALRGDTSALTAAVQTRPVIAMAGLARRHRCAAALCAALQPAEGRESVALRAYLQRDRWAAALSVAHLRRQTLDVLRIAHENAIAAVPLKGAQRALLHLPEAELYPSSDIDVLVPPEQVERLCEALMRAGYVQPAKDSFYPNHHHAAPLVKAGALPVEVHHALSKTPLSVPKDYAALASHLRTLDAGGMPVTILDPVATALHLAVHTLQRPALREMLLLAQQLLRMDESERRALRGLLEREPAYRSHLIGAVVFACEMAGIPWSGDDDSARFAEWMKLREELPRPLRARTACADAWIGAPRSRRIRAMLAAPPPGMARAAVHLAATCAIAVYVRFMSR